MKLIAGSILASFGLLVTALGHLSRAPSRPTPSEHLYYALDTPVEVIAILFILGGIGLIGWGIWETVKKKE